MKIQHSIEEAPCPFKTCKWYIVDEDNYIIGIECLTCRFFSKLDNRTVNICTTE